MYYDIINKIYEAVRWNHSSCEDQDAMRSATNYGAFTAYVEVLQTMGHKAEEGDLRRVHSQLI